MKDGLVPIPIPARQRWLYLRQRVIPALVFCGTLAAIGLLWDAHVAAPTLVGQAEAQLASVSSSKPGTLVSLSVSRFQNVRAGEILGRVIVAEPQVLETSLAVINAEIEMLRANLSPMVSQQRNAINYGQLRMAWMKERADLAMARVNMQVNEGEYHRAEELFQAKIGSEAARDIARATFEMYQHQVTELTALVAAGEQSLQDMQVTNTADIGKMSDAPLQAAIGVQEAKLRQVEADLTPVALKAPIDGVVTAIAHWSGEAVVAGQPIVSIASAEPLRIVGYLRSPLTAEPAAGDRVEIRTRRRQRVTAAAEITAVGGQLETIPAVFSGVGRLDAAQQGLPVNISLPASLKIQPGELVDITLLPAKKL